MEIIRSFLDYDVLINFHILYLSVFYFVYLYIR